MKSSGGDKQGRRRLPHLSESQHRRLRLVSVAAAFFLFLSVFLLSSRREFVVSSKASLEDDARTPVVGTRRSPSTAVGTRPEQGHAAQDHLQRSTAGQRHDGPDGHGNEADAATASSSGGPAAPAAADDVDHDKSAPTPAAADTARPAAVGNVSERGHPHPDPGDITTYAESDERPRPRPPLCDFSNPRADVCDFHGDIRMDANASAFVVVYPASSSSANGTTTTYKVRPYPRKGDVTSMGRVAEITVRATADAEAAPRCTAKHAAPAVVFSVGGYAGNLFHDFTDLIVPLYGTAQRFRGDVQLVVTDAAPRWLAKYGAFLRGLSRHPLLDLAKAAAAGEVHCFRHAVVGLRASRELIIERPGGGTDEPTTAGFTRFLRRALSLPRDAPTPPPVKRPRLLVVTRRGTRLLLNLDAVMRAAEEVGFEAVASDLDAGTDDDVARVARLVNSCDAMVGVHGAGLTNMVFLPPGAAVVQIVPWGGLRWIARMDFGDPAEAMELRYIQYEVAVEESTLKDKYPRDHEVFTNPTALHKKGFKFMRQTFLKDQDIILDVHRFRPVLLQMINSLAL